MEWLRRTLSESRGDHFLLRQVFDDLLALDRPIFFDAARFAGTAGGAIGHPIMWRYTTDKP